MLGTISNWGARGWGFIQPADGGSELFVHGAAFGGVTPAVGDPVEYTEFRGLDGRVIASNPKLLSAEQAEARRCLG